MMTTIGVPRLPGCDVPECGFARPGACGDPSCGRLVRRLMT